MFHLYLASDVSFRCTVRWLDIIIPRELLRLFKGGTRVEPYVVISGLLTIFPTLYFPSPWLISTIYILSSLSPFPPSSQPLTHQATIHPLVFGIYEFVFILFIPLFL